MEVKKERDELLPEIGLKLLHKHYMMEDETSQQEAFKRAAECYSGGDSELATRLYDYVSKGWFMFSSPQLSNAVKEGERVKGLPIACYITHPENSIKGLNEHTVEYRNLVVKGGGVGGYWGDVESINQISSGVVGFLHPVDADMLVYKQGKTRRGAYAAYLDISHPEIMDFIKMRTPTGDLNRKNLNLHHGVNITDKFIHAVDNDLDWELIDPKDGTVKEVVKARGLWETILETRYRTGEPYIHNVDESNRRLHPALKVKGFKVHASNLCSEITLPTSPDRTAVCCLASVNLAKYDEWKDTQMVIDLIRMLDNVLDFFVKHAPAEMEKAAYSAMMERSLGLGAMGLSDYLMARGIPFESATALSINRSMFKRIKEDAVYATAILAKERGEAPDGKGFGVRNLHLLAVAPNSNSSLILGVTPSVEPRFSNAYTQKTRVGSYLIKNPYLEKRLEELGKNTDEVWDDIIEHDGSVQHLDFLTDDDKLLFRTAMEIDQRWVIDHARMRQEFVCQSQSINVFFPAKADRAYVNAVHRRAFAKDGLGVPLKTLYYLRTVTSVSTESVNKKIERKALGDGTECLACEG